MISSLIYFKNYRAIILSRSLLIVSSFLGIPSSLACDPSSSTSSFSTQEDFSQYFTQKYSFSAPQLDITKVTMALFKADPQTQTKLMALLEQEASKGDSAAVEKLYTFLTKPIGALDFRHLDQGKSKQLLQQGLDQEQTWAYWEKGQLAITSQTPLTRWHCLAANREDASQSQKDYVQTHLKQTWLPSLEEIKKLAQGNLFTKEKNRKTFITKVQEFANYWETVGSIKPFHNLFTFIRSVKTYKDIREQGYLYALQKAADLGCLQSQVICANTYKEFGNSDRCLQYLLKATKQEHAQAIFKAAYLLGEGFEGHPANKRWSLELYLRASQLGYVEAMFNAAELLRQGFNEQPADKRQALNLYLQAADKGDAEAMVNAGSLLVEGFEGQPSDKERGLNLQLKAAQLGVVDAMFNAAVLLEEGFDGQPADKRRALDLYLQATDKGFVEAIVNAALLLEDGFDGQPADKRRALDLYLQAIKKGDSQAMINAGCLFYQGFKGQPKDKNKALQLFLRAANEGNLAAMHNAALLLENGFREQPADTRTAFDFYLKAAHKGFSRSMLNLALLYLKSYEENEQKDKNDLTSALFWLEKAVLLNEPLASQYLAKAKSLAFEEASSSFQLPDKEEEDQELEHLLRRSLDPVKAPTIVLPLPLIEPSTIKERSTDVSTEGSHTSTTTVSSVPTFSTAAPSSGQEIENQEESGDSPEDSLEMPPSLPTLDQKGTQKVNNVKLLRKNLREIGRIAKEQAMQREQNILLTLSPTEQAIANAIWAKETTAIDHNTLTTLFSAPFFQGQVNLTPTKKGIVVSAFNRSTNQHASTGTHRKHNKSYKGAQPTFVKDLRSILALFGVKPNTGQ